jgi:hypothetical protein
MFVVIFHRAGPCRPIMVQVYTAAFRGLHHPLSKISLREFRRFGRPAEPVPSASTGGV